MAEIPVERKSNLNRIWLLLAIIFITILIWWATAEDGVEVEEPIAAEELAAGIPQDTTLTAPNEVAIGAVLANPQAYIDSAGLSGTVSVAEVPTDRGFWVEQQGQRMFAVLIDQPQEEPKDIDPGQQLQITGGMVRDSSYLANIPGAPLDETTASIAREQNAFLVVDEANIEILSQG